MQISFPAGGRVNPGGVVLQRGGVAMRGHRGFQPTDDQVTGAVQQGPVPSPRIDQGERCARCTSGGHDTCSGGSKLRNNPSQVISTISMINRLQGSGIEIRESRQLNILERGGDA